MEIQSVSYEEACFRLVSLSEVSNIVCLLVIQCNNVSSYFEMFIKLKYIHAFDNSWRKKVEHFKSVWLKIHLSDVISMSWSAVCECERKKSCLSQWKVTFTPNSLISWYYINLTVRSSHLKKFDWFFVDVKNTKSDSNLFLMPFGANKEKTNRV